MSLEHLREYAYRCANEPELRARAKAIGFADPEAHIQHAESLGLQFSMDEAIAFHNEMVGADGEMTELGEEELAHIAGGVVGDQSVLAAAVVGGAGSAAAVAGHSSGW